MSTEVEPIRVLIVDDHAVLREGLARLLSSEPDIRVVATAGTVNEALHEIGRTEINLVLLDFELQVGTGAELQHEIRNSGQQIKVLFLTAGMSDSQVRDAMASGASGIFLKNESPGLLPGSIRDVMRGRTWLSQAQAQLLLSDSSPAHRQDSFTEREQAVMKRVVAGLPNKVIADELCSSESAVKSVLQQLFRKTGVRTRGQLVRVALEQYRHLL